MSVEIESHCGVFQDLSEANRTSSRSDGLRMVPRAIITDRLASYAAAKAVVMPTVSHLRGWRQNNRVENSHQPVRQRVSEGCKRFKSLRNASRFCSVFTTV